MFETRKRLSFLLAKKAAPVLALGPGNKKSAPAPQHCLITRTLIQRDALNQMN